MSKHSRHTTIPQKLAIFYLLLLIIIGIFGPLFSSTAPWKMELNGKTVYPAWTYYIHQLGMKDLPQGWTKIEWKSESNQVENLIPFDANYIDLTSIGGVAPGVHGHLLGTDMMGRDIFAGIIQGAHVSLIIAILSVVFALLIAWVLVIFTSYQGNDRIRFNWIQGLGFIALLVLAYYYFFIACRPINGFKAVELGLSTFLWILCAILFYHGVQKFIPSKWARSYFISMDELGLKIYEVFYAVPKLLILLILIGILSSRRTEHEILQLSVIMGFLVWPSFYRYIRLEIIREKASEYFVAMQNLGFSDIRIIMVHIFPKAMRIILVPIIFVFSAVILTEATLSFLGIGLSEGYISWGNILAQARLRIDAWWMAVFPGLVIFLTIYSLNILGRRLNM